MLPDNEKIFRKVLKEPNLVLHKDLNASDVNGWDSLTHIQLITEIEKVYKVKFALGELGSMKNVGDLITALEAKIH